MSSVAMVFGPSTSYVDMEVISVNEFLAIRVKSFDDSFRRNTAILIWSSQLNHFGFDTQRSEYDDYFYLQFLMGHNIELFILPNH